VLQFAQMRKTITIRLLQKLAEWLESTASKAGISQGSIVRDQLEKARAQATSHFFGWRGKFRLIRVCQCARAFQRSECHRRYRIFSCLRESARFTS
jgi:hypothetical protein